MKQHKIAGQCKVKVVATFKGRFVSGCFLCSGLLFAGCSPSVPSQMQGTEYILASPAPDGSEVRVRVYDNVDGRVWYSPMVDIKTANLWMRPVVVLNGKNSEATLSRLHGVYLNRALPGENWSGYMWRDIGFAPHSDLTFGAGMFASDKRQGYSAISEKPTRIEVYYDDKHKHPVYWNSTLFNPALGHGKRSAQRN